MPTLSPLPEVLLNTMTQMKTEKADSRKPGAGSNNEGYMNMNFGANKKSANIQAAATRSSSSKFSFDEAPGSGDVTPTVMPSTPSRLEASQPVRIPLKANDDKENSVVIALPNVVVESETSVPASNNGVTASAATPTNAIPNKQRANSLEKIVCALEKAIIGPKRHSSGDKPIKRSSGTLIHRYFIR